MLAEQIGAKLKGGEVIELASDLGGGKTTFVRGLAKGMGSTDTVRSPSFTISNEYRSGKLTMYHFDFYRLQEPGIMRDELAESLEDPSGIVVLEWAGIIKDVLPADRLSLHIRATGETTRELRVQYPEQYRYLLPSNGEARE